MNTKEINCIINENMKLNNFILGVYSSNEIGFISSIKKYPVCLIMNTDTTGLPGKHWLVIIVHSKVKFEIFDSFGHTLDHYNLRHILPEKISIIYNKIKVQDDNSQTCGFHCLTFTYLRCNGLSMKHIIDNFYSKYALIKNDIFCVNFVSSRFPVCVCDNDIKKLYV
jgi:hypothetical protein